MTMVSHKTIHSMAMVQLYRNHWKTINYNGTLTKTIDHSIVLKIWPSLWSTLSNIQSFIRPNLRLKKFLFLPWRMRLKERNSRSCLLSWNMLLQTRALLPSPTNSAFVSWLSFGSFTKTNHIAEIPYFWYFFFFNCLPFLAYFLKMTHTMRTSLLSKTWDLNRTIVCQLSVYIVKFHQMQTNLWFSAC